LVSRKKKNTGYQLFFGTEHSIPATVSWFCLLKVRGKRVEEKGDHYHGKKRTPSVNVRSGEEL